MRAVRRYLALGLVGLLLAGCSGDEPSPVAADAGAGGDGGAGDPAPFPAPFLGVWVYGSGQEKLECPGMTTLMGDLAQATLTFQRGTSTALVMASPLCNLNFDVQGSTAMVRAGQMCTATLANNPATFRPQTFTFALEGGQAARQMAGWQVTLMPARGAPVECVLSAAGVLTRR